MSATPSPAEGPVTLRTNTERNLVRIGFRGRVTGQDLIEPVRGFEQQLPALRPGFSLVTDLTDLESMDLDCVPHITRIMDLCRTHGIGRVVRIIPDPDKDIGFNLLSIVHYRGKVPTATYATRAEAERGEGREEGGS